MYGISSPVAVLAAATQRTSRIELGTAVMPVGWENPLRLAEVEVFEVSSNRVQPHSEGFGRRMRYRGASHVGGDRRTPPRARRFPGGRPGHDSPATAATE